MAQSWAKSFSYRDARDGLQARFAKLAEQDRVVTHELFPNLSSIDGFLFAINSAPAEVSPTEWLPDLLPLVQLPDEKPAEAVNLLISYALHSASRLEQQKYPLPDESDPVGAMKPASPMNSFSHGFERGYERVKSIWSAMIADELRGELDSQLFALKFFASTDYARDYLKARDSVMRPDQLAEQVLNNFPKAADLHVRLGMAIEAGQSPSH